MKLQFDHPTIEIQTPAPGHFVIRGHHPKPALTDEGHVVPHQECYITDEVPTAALLAIIAARGEAEDPAPTVASIAPRAAGLDSLGRRIPVRRKPAAEGDYLQTR